ncbi:MAG: hypothetical protein PUB21_02285, partial [Bacteroidales bacterium]|nr:hypothetical protein [Bacteroidales bacterium]
MGTFFKKNRVKAGEFLLFLSGTLVLVSLFMTSSHLYDGILIAKEHWFRYTSSLFGSATFLFFLFGKKRRPISFSTSDVFVLMGIGWSILTYNEVINPAPERMGLLIQLAAFWFFLRFSFTEYPRLRKAFLFILIVTAIIEVMIGMSQLYGINRSFNPNYRITGSFFNPGPFAGYIAVAFPLLLDFLLKQYNERKGTNRKYPFWFWGGVVSFALMLAVLPSTLSRSAWLAALIPSFLIIVYRLDWWKKWQEWRSESGSRSIWIVLGLPLILILFIASLYALKKDSA